MNILTKVLCLAALFIAVFAVIPAAHASSGSSNTLDTSGVMNAPTAQTNVVQGLNEALKWVFIFLKFLAIIACAYGSYMVWKGEFSSGIWAYVAALLLFFAPALVNLAQSLGGTANNGTP